MSYLKFLKLICNLHIVRTYVLSDINDLFRPLEDIMRNEFIPALTGGMTCSKEERLLLSLPPRLGGMGVTMFHEEAQHMLTHEK